MKKEIFIVSIVVVVIIVLHIISQIYTHKKLDSVIAELDILESKLLEENKNDLSNLNLEKDFENIHNKWRKKYDFFACFIEHDELEKAETQMISISASIKVEDYDKSVDEIEKCKFILKHIEEKDSLKVVNIF